MVARNKSHSKLNKRIRKLEAQLAALEPGHPRYTDKKRGLKQEIKLVKAELKSAPSKKSGKKSSKRASTGSGKKPPLPGGASFPSFKLPSPKSPTFYEDSVKTMSSLRSLCKSCVGYMQRADQLFDGLHSVGSQLHQQGVLPKITGGKFKDLTSGEWTALLMALLNSPLSGFLLGGGGGGDSDGKKEEGDS